MYSVFNHVDDALAHTSNTLGSITVEEVEVFIKYWYFLKKKW